MSTFEEFMIDHAVADKAKLALVREELSRTREALRVILEEYEKSLSAGSKWQEYDAIAALRKEFNL